jgi:predicted amidohydrolase YtcJ
MQILYAARHAPTLDGNPAGGWFPEERLDLETALRAYTVDNAWAAGEEGEKGRLMAGFLADFVILERDLFEITPEEIKDVRALVTVVGGRFVHDAGEIARNGPGS